jgi:Rps23 Pro-64 3,4-dihydroxylase Tpa1-like proline 4-hydroxylase
MVLDPRTTRRGPGELSPAFLTDDQETQRAFDPGLAQTVLPKPNRIVFISPTAQHLLTRVDVNAGQTARLSVAGFFHKQAPANTARSDG